MIPTGMSFLVSQVSQTPPEQLHLGSTAVVYKGGVTEMDVAEQPLALRGTDELGMRGWAHKLMVLLCANTRAHSWRVPGPWHLVALAFSAATQTDGC